MRGPFDVLSAYLARTKLSHVVMNVRDWEALLRERGEDVPEIPEWVHVVLLTPEGYVFGTVDDEGNPTWYEKT
jgi:hypothetical protein